MEEYQNIGAGNIDGPQAAAVQIARPAHRATPAVAVHLNNGAGNVDGAPQAAAIQIARPAHRAAAAIAVNQIARPAHHAAPAVAVHLVAIASIVYRFFSAAILSIFYQICVGLVLVTELSKIMFRNLLGNPSSISVFWSSHISSNFVLLGFSLQGCYIFLDGQNIGAGNVDGAPQAAAVQNIGVGNVDGAPQAAAVQIAHPAHHAAPAVAVHLNIGAGNVDVAPQAAAFQIARPAHRAAAAIAVH